MLNGTRLSAGISRRALATAGAGWALSTGGLLLPAAIDEAVARKGDKGGKKDKNRNGQGKSDKQSGQRKSGGKKATKSGDTSESGEFLNVRITFVNGTASDTYVESYGSQTGKDVAPQARTRFEVPYSIRDYAAMIYVGKIDSGAPIDNPSSWEQRYVLYTANPTVGLPYVKIFDTATQNQIFNEALEKMQEVETDRFRLKRLANSDAVLFILTLLENEF